MENTKKQTKTEKIREAVKCFPYLIPMYIKDKSFDPKITYGIMKKMLPLRFSIEFECLGAIEPNRKISSINLANKYKVYSLNRDYCCNTNTPFEERNDLNEHRVSILGFKQLAGLYQVLEVMKNNCIDCKGSGIHIHIDISPFYYPTTKKRNWYGDDFYLKLQQVLIQNSYLDKVHEIFGNKYYGTYNRKTCSINEKGRWINIRTNYDTIEFRIGNLTFDYTELIDIVIKLQSLVKKVNREINNKNKITKGYNITKYHPLDRKSKKM